MNDFVFGDFLNLSMVRENRGDESVEAVVLNHPDRCIRLFLIAMFKDFLKKKLLSILYFSNTTLNIAQIR